MNSYVIGITGNIGTGKSLVRGMLERLGALGIDADALVHRALLKGTLPYQEVISSFGNQIQNANGEINRSKLARIVFQNEKGLQKLEAILHPAVEKATLHLIEVSTLPIIVVEAIKLLESDLVKICDSVWLVDAPPEKQLERVIVTRAMRKNEVLQRIEQQSPANVKMKAADVIIHNQYSIIDTWNQVKNAWQRLREIDPHFQKADSENLEGRQKNLGFLELNLDDLDMINCFTSSQSQPYIITQDFFLPSQVQEFKRKALVEKLCNYLCFASPNNTQPTKLSWMIHRNFILQPGMIFSATSFTAKNDLSKWLEIIHRLAEMRACEAIILPCGNYNIEEQAVLQNLGYIKPDSHMPVYSFWKSEFTKKDAAGYNGMVKFLRPVVLFN